MASYAVCIDCLSRGDANESSKLHSCDMEELCERAQEHDTSNASCASIRRHREDWVSLVADDIVPRLVGCATAERGAAYEYQCRRSLGCRRRRTGLCSGWQERSKVVLARDETG